MGPPILVVRKQPQGGKRLPQSLPANKEWRWGECVLLSERVGQGSAGSSGPVRGPGLHGGSSLAEEESRPWEPEGGWATHPRSPGGGRNERDVRALLSDHV